ncbi:GGDEF domain-containing protein [Actinospica robiniae]|uniref:GGDEF domain-containing protein n=1 Tax=Actinospica robiniae TaxID=304901 RepID=UPI000405A677|nr:GGDEF domain-containing protein [Actinospica robiniae]
MRPPAEPPATPGAVTPQFAASVAGGLLIIGAALSAGLTASLAVNSPELINAYRPAVYAVSAVAGGLGLAVIAARNRLPLRLLYGYPAFAYILICAPAVVSGTSTLFGQTLMLWPVLYSGYLMPETVTWVTLIAGLAASGALAGAAQGSTGHAAGLGITLGVTLLASSAVVISLRRRIDTLVEHMRREARTDALTGLANVRAFETVLDRELLIYERHGSPLSLLAIDIDYFKRINDAAGHPAGDATLRRLADLFTHAVRRSDTVARVGGEEFGVLLTDTTCAQAAERAEALRQATQDASAHWPQPLTISIGVATIPDHALDAPTLRATGDTALYAAKSAGRNTVRTAPRRGQDSP